MCLLPLPPRTPAPTPLAFLCFWKPPGSVWPLGFCTLNAFFLECSHPRLSGGLSLVFFQSLLRCHLPDALTSSPLLSFCFLILLYFPSSYTSHRKMIPIMMSTSIICEG